MADILSVKIISPNFDNNTEFQNDFETLSNEIKEYSACELVGKFSAPYHLAVQKQEGKIIFHFTSANNSEEYTHIFSLMPYRSLLQEYTDIKESYREAMQAVGTLQLETIDMARRGIHNEAAELLQTSFAPKINIDFETARLFFSLLAFCAIYG